MGRKSLTYGLNVVKVTLKMSLFSIIIMSQVTCVIRLKCAFQKGYNGTRVYCLFPYPSIKVDTIMVQWFA